MTPERFNKIEDSVSLLGEAVAELRTIAKVVVAEHGARIKELEVDVDNLKDSIYEACDIKTKEIDSKIADAISATRELIGTNFKYTLWMAGAILGLGGILITGFVMYMSYIDTKSGEMDAKLVTREAVSVKNGENIIHLKEDQIRIHEEIKDVHEDLKEILKAVK